MATNTFSYKVRRWIDRSLAQTVDVQKEIATEFLDGVMTRSPVDTGRFRASHQASRNRVNTQVAEERATRSESFSSGDAPSRAEPNYAAGLQEIDAVQPEDVVYITNNLFYAKELELGVSPQAPGPDGIYGATYTDVMARLDSIIAAARRSNGG